MASDAAGGSPELKAVFKKKGLGGGGSAKPGESTPSPELRAAVARVAHHVPGRMRLKFDRDVDVEEAADRLRTVLKDRPGVTGVEARPATNSVVVRYDAAVADLQGLMTEEGFAEAAVDVLDAGLREVAHVASVTPAGRSVVRAVGGANARLRRSTGGLVDLRDVLPLSLLGLGIGRLLQTGFEPVPWSTLIYYSFSTFTILQSHRVVPPGAPSEREAEKEAAQVAEAQPSALEILRQRFARGEITSSDYRSMYLELEPPPGGA